MPVARRAPLARALMSRVEDASDHNMPSLVWTALIPVADADPASLVALSAGCRLPGVLRPIARRLAEDIESRPAPLNALLASSVDQPAAFRSQVLAGVAEGLTGWRKAPRPRAWDAFRSALDTASDRDRARDLDVLFGDGRALDEVRKLALDNSAPIEARKAALKTLIESRPPDLRAVCERLVGVRFLNSTAVGGLALFDDPAIGKTLAANYRRFHPTERPAAMEALASRPAFARALLDQIASEKIPRQDLTAFHARQIRSLGDSALSARLAEVWGELRESPADRRERAAKLKASVDSSALAQADRSRGRAVFEKVCASCHKLHGRGGEVGPDLTGGGRENVDYLLENLVDPSASVSADFRMSVVAMRDGRVLNGLVRGSTARTLTLQTQTESLVLDRGEIEEVRPSPNSLMPEGLLDPLTPAEVRDLLAYLMHRTQVPLPPQAP
jgi:putative heme-binding domain-containing protein